MPSLASTVWSIQSAAVLDLYLADYRSSDFNFNVPLKPSTPVSLNKGAFPLCLALTSIGIYISYHQHAVSSWVDFSRVFGTILLHMVVFNT